MLPRLNTLTQKYFSLILILASLAAMFIPEPDPGSARWLLVLLAVIIFASFFRVSLGDGKLATLMPQATVYVILRFLILPLAVFVLVLPFSSFYAFCLAFLFLMPAAVASPTYVSLFDISVNMPVLVLVFSSFLSIITIPLLTPLLFHGQVHISSWPLLKAVLLTILLPFLLHLPVRKVPEISRVISENLSLITSISLVIMLLIAISLNRKLILADPAGVLIDFILGTVAYVLMFFSGWLMGFRKGIDYKISNSISSGMNNIGLGISLSILYLKPEVSVFLIMAEFVWVFILLPVRLMFQKVHRTESGLKE
jgi:predicted Na+-dependent transporter